MDLNGKVENLIADFDNTGLVLAIGTNYRDSNGRIFNKIVLHSIENKIDSGEFLTIIMKDKNPIKQMIFKKKLIGCLLSNGNIKIVDSYDGTIIRDFNLKSDPNNPLPKFSFTPDSKFILTGGQDGMVRVFEAESGIEISKYTAHSKFCKMVKFSPRYLLFVSVAENLIFWIPKFWENVGN